MTVLDQVDEPLGGVRTEVWGCHGKDRHREFRLSAEDKQLINEAAALSGTTFTGFVLEEARARAQEILAAERTISLPADAYLCFLEAIDPVREPVPALGELGQRATRFRRNS